MILPTEILKYTTSHRPSPQTQFEHLYTETVHSLDIFHTSKSLNESCKSAPRFLTPRRRSAF
jgi:hypothetical protein